MNSEDIRALLAERLGLPVKRELTEVLAKYLALLLRWNARTNLTAIRESEAIVLRHFGESLKCAAAIPAGLRTLLDYGSGAGFPGAVCALARPELAVTLAESQGRKAGFLRELCRSLDLKATVHAGRVEALPAGLLFDAVTLRAVDSMEEACAGACERTKPGGWLVVMTTHQRLQELAPKLTGVDWRSPVLLTGSEQGLIALGKVLGG